MPVLKIKKDGEWLEVAGGGSGGASVQPDWSQNDPSAANYIQNRTHYSSVVENELLSKTEYMHFNQYPLSGYHELQAGYTYKVTFDGTEYTCVGVYDEELQDVIVGNIAIYSNDLEGTHEPFIIRLWAVMPNSLGDHTISIVCVADSDGNTMEEVLVDEDTFTTYYPSEQISSNLTFVEGQTYIVTLNGERYECVAWCDNDGAIIIGNGDIYGGEGMGDDVPFSCDSYDDGECYLNITWSGEYTITIATIEEHIKKIDRKFLPDGIGGGASGQPDYNQNDPTAADYIKNRPFYMGDLVETEICDINAALTEQGDEWSTHPEEPTDGTNYLWGAECLTIVTLEVGKQYTVEINGNKYTSVATSENIGMDVVAIGDFVSYASGDFSNFNYTFISVPNMGSIPMYKGVEPPTEFKIYSLEQELVKIDPKFLPEGGVGYMDRTETVLLEEQTVEGFDVMEDPIYAVQNPFEINLETGSVYTITWDGTAYDVECKAHPDWGFVYVGNENYVDMVAGGEIPFCIIVDGTNIFLATESEDYSHTIEINGFGQVPVKIDPKFLPEQVQPDWNENDPEAEGYIENRPFYDGLVAGDVLFEEQTFEDFSSGNLSESVAFIEGETYFVTLNGEQYKCVAWFDETLNSMFGQDAVGIGSTAFTGFTNKGSNGEPFYLAYTGEKTVFVVENVGTHTLKIQSATTAVAKKIDKKFLPDDIGSVKSVNGVEPDENGNIAVEIPEGFSGSWNDLIDKPFEVGTVYYKWDSGEEYETVSLFDGQVSYAKISNDAPEKEFFIGKMREMVYETGAVYYEDITSDHINFEYPEGAYDLMDSVRVVSADSFEYNGATFTKGIWVRIYPDMSTLEFYTPSIPIDESIIPDTIARVKDLERDWSQNDNTSSNYIKNRTHYAIHTQEHNWDGDISGKESFMDGYYKIGSAYEAKEVSNEQLKAGIIIECQGNDGVEEYRTVPVQEILNDSCVFTDDFAMIGGILVIRKDNLEFEGIQLPNAGIWFANFKEDGFSMRVVSLSYPEEVVQLPEIYIPDTIARKDDFYSYEKKNLIYQGKITTDTIVASGLHSEAQGYFTDNSFILDQNKKYVVNFDGTDYVCKVNSDANNYYAIGNFYMTLLFALRNETEEVKNSKLAMVNIVDTKEPFCISVLHDGTDCSIITKEAGTYSIQIYEAEVREINDAYISSTFACANDLYGQVGADPTMQVYYEWDENVVYDEVVDTIGEAPSSGVAKISNDAPESDFFVGKYIYVTGHDMFGTRTLLADMIKTSDIETVQDGLYKINNCIIVVTATSINLGGIEVTQGIWCADGFDRSQEAWFSNIRITDSKKILVDTIIPDTIARAKNVVTTPVTAQVGQAIVVKSVDENGRPVDWEAVDMPDASAPKNEFILNSSTEGSAKKFKITIDDDGVLTATEVVE